MYLYISTLQMLFGNWHYYRYKILVSGCSPIWLQIHLAGRRVQNNSLGVPILLYPLWYIYFFWNCNFWIVKYNFRSNCQILWNFLTFKKYFVANTNISCQIRISSPPFYCEYLIVNQIIFDKINVSKYKLYRLVSQLLNNLNLISNYDFT